MGPISARRTLEVTTAIETAGAKGRELRIGIDSNSYAALGRAVSYLMTKPSFARQPFGVWSRTLTGQINRKHYFFVLRSTAVVGFAGWALVDEVRGEEWLRGAGDISSGDCVNGDCMVINAWAADSEAVNRFILRQIRRSLIGLKAAYAKRFYTNGTVRPLRVKLSDAVEKHVAADGQAAGRKIME